MKMKMIAVMSNQQKRPKKANNKFYLNLNQFIIFSQGPPLIAPWNIVSNPELQPTGTACFAANSAPEAKYLPTFPSGLTAG